MTDKCKYEEAQDGLYQCLKHPYYRTRKDCGYFRYICEDYEVKND